MRNTKDTNKTNSRLTPDSIRKLAQRMGECSLRPLLDALRVKRLMPESYQYEGWTCRLIRQEYPVVMYEARYEHRPNLVEWEAAALECHPTGWRKVTWICTARPQADARFDTAVRLAAKQADRRKKRLALLRASSWGRLASRRT